MERVPPSVLVIDDQTFFHVWMTEALEGLYEVVFVRDSPAAFQALADRTFAAIILDIVLEQENGLDLIAQLRAKSSAPILIMTGHDNEGYAIRAANLKVDGYIKKTCSPAEL